MRLGNPLPSPFPFFKGTIHKGDRGKSLHNPQPFFPFLTHNNYSSNHNSKKHSNNNLNLNILGKRIVKEKKKKDKKLEDKVLFRKVEVKEEFEAGRAYFNSFILSQIGGFLNSEEKTERVFSINNSFSFSWIGLRYLFNCGEGTLRRMKIMDYPITNITHVFISDMSAGSISGLPAVIGYLVNTRSSHLPPLILIGPAGIKDWLFHSFVLTSTPINYKSLIFYELINPSHSDDPCHHSMKKNTLLIPSTNVIDLSDHSPQKEINDQLNPLSDPPLFPSQYCLISKKIFPSPSSSQSTSPSQTPPSSQSTSLSPSLSWKW